MCNLLDPWYFLTSVECGKRCRNWATREPGKKHPPGDQPLWLLPLALSEVSCFLTLLDSSFGDNCCPSVFASRLNLNIQGLYIFLECSSPAVQSLQRDNACSYHGLLLPLLALLSYLKGKENVDASLKQCFFILFCDD